MADRNDLLDILGAQVAEVLRTGDDERTMVGALALIEFLRRDPRLSGIVGELLGEAEAEKRRFREHCRKVVAEVRGLWQRHREAFERSRAEAGEALDFGIHGGFEGFERRLVDPSDDILPAHIEPSDDNSQAHQGLDDLSYWCRNLIQFLEHKKRDPGRAIKALDRRLRALTERQEEMFQRFWVAARALAGFALQRLSYFAEWLIPPSGDEPTDGTQWLLAYRVRLTRKALFDPTVRKSEKGQREFQASAVRLRRDVELLCRGVREKIIVGRSRVALMRRFAARCVRYEATRLRDIATRRQKGRQSAEAALTMEFARFMFDSGLNPFVDPSVAGLRPDVLDPHLGTPIYVEAKQYATRDPRRIVVAAVRQVWDTWARLRTTYEIPEAFVLVFRLGGAGIVLPEWVAYGEQRLYLQAVDVAPAETSGSKQRFQPVEFSEDELGPLRGRRKRKRPR